MTSYYGFATIDTSPRLTRPYQFNIPAIRLEIDETHLGVSVPGWMRIVYFSSTRGFSMPLTEITAFEQDGCAVKLTFLHRVPMWFCPSFLSGSLEDLMALLHSRGVPFQPGRNVSFMGLCSEWHPPPVAAR